MGPLRDAIRYAIFESLQNPTTTDISSTMIFISSSLKKAETKHDGFEDKEGLNVGLYVPALIPPGGKPGASYDIVESVIASFTEIGGGCSMRLESGTWKDENGATHNEPMVVINSHTPMKDWYIWIPILRTHIREIQVKLNQICVLVTIDSKTYGDGPIDLLGPVHTSEFPIVDESWTYDEKLTEYFPNNESGSKNKKETGNNTQELKGDGNIQISASGNVTINNSNKSSDNQSTDFEKLLNDYKKEVKENQKMKTEKKYDTSIKEAESEKDELRKRITELEKENDRLKTEEVPTIITNHTNTVPPMMITDENFFKSSKEVLQDILDQIMPDFERDMKRFNVAELPDEDDGSGASEVITEYLELALLEIEEVKNLQTDNLTLFYENEYGHIETDHEQFFITFEHSRAKRKFLFFVDFCYGTHKSFEASPLDSRKFRKESLTWIDEDVSRHIGYISVDRFSCVSSHPMIALNPYGGVRAIIFGAEIEEN